MGRDRESWTIRQMVAPDVGRERPGQINESCNSCGQIETRTILKIVTLDMRHRDTMIITHIETSLISIF